MKQMRNSSHEYITVKLFWALIAEYAAKKLHLFCIYHCREQLAYLHNI